MPPPSSDDEVQLISPPSKKRKEEIDRLRSKQGKSARVQSRLDSREANFYEEKGAFAETYKKKYLTEEELAVDVDLCNNPLNMQDIADTNQKILMQLSKFLVSEQI